MKHVLRAMLAATFASALMASGSASAMPLANSRAAPSPDNPIVQTKMMHNKPLMSHKRAMSHKHMKHHGMMRGHGHMMHQAM